MNHAVVVMLCFVAVVAGAFVVACRNYRARIARDKSGETIPEETIVS